MNISISTPITCPPDQISFSPASGTRFIVAMTRAGLVANEQADNFTYDISHLILVVANVRNAAANQYAALHQSDRQP